MRQYDLPTHSSPDEGFAKANTLGLEGIRVPVPVPIPVPNDGAAMSEPLMPLPETPPALDYYHQQVKDSGGHNSDVFVSPAFHDKTGNVHLLDPPPPPPPSQDPGLQSQDHGLTVAAGQPYRETMVINHYPPHPPPVPVWPQDIWVHSGICRVLYQPVLVLGYEMPGGQPAPAPFRPPQQMNDIPPLAEDQLPDGEVLAEMFAAEKQQQQQ